MSLRPQMKQRGAVAVLVALLLVFFLIAAVGLALDLGRLFVNKTELQNAADACALAAARELKAHSNTLAVLTRAENAGISVGYPRNSDRPRNRSDFQHDEVRFVTDQDVTFSETLDGTYVTKGSASTDVAYVRCTRQVPGFLQWFPQLLWLGGSSDIFPVSATAVATMGGGGDVLMSCPVPLAMCMEKSPAPPCKSTSVVPDAFGLCKGQWYPGGLGWQHVVGNWNWIDYAPHSGGAPEIAAALAGLPRPCEVDVNKGVVHAETGNMQSLDDAWNSRFGLYKNKYNADTAVPDFTGYAYGSTNWPLGRDAYADFLSRRETYATYPGSDTDVGPKSEIDTKGFTKPSTDHDRGADRRVVVMPVVDCTDWGSTHEVAVLGWACALMVQPWPPNMVPIKLEYLGPTTADDAPCGVYGQPGGTGGSGPRVPMLVQ